MKEALVCRAMTRASVVLPTPGGPQKIMEPMLSEEIRRRSTFPGPSRCCCPAISSSEEGRIRAASGWPYMEGASSGSRVFSLMTSPPVLIKVLYYYTVLYLERKANKRRLTIHPSFRIMGQNRNRLRQKDVLTRRETCRSTTVSFTRN